MSEVVALTLILPGGEKLLLKSRPPRILSSDVVEISVQSTAANIAEQIASLDGEPASKPPPAPPLPRPAPKAPTPGVSDDLDALKPGTKAPAAKDEALEPSLLDLQAALSAPMSEPPAPDASTAEASPGEGMSYGEIALPESQPVGRITPDEPEELPKKDPPPHIAQARVAPAVGIDFGTSYSSVAVYVDGEVRMIPSDDGEIQMPSVVSFPKPGLVLVGAKARQRMAGEAQWTIASPKRLLGRPYKDPQVSQHLSGIAFRTFSGSDKFTRFEAHGSIYSVTDLCSLVLKQMQERASKFLGAEVTKAVFAVPVGHGSLQRSALELAARQAGLEEVGMLTEPSASVLCHGFYAKDCMVAVYDFGGGTFDFCVLQIQDTAFQVLCAGGDSWLGGDDFDNAMGNHLADEFWSETGVDLRTRAVEWQALLFACEQAKRELSLRDAAEIRADDLLFTSEGRKGLRYKMSRGEFDELSSNLVEKSITITDKVMSQAGISPNDVDAVVMSGGTSLIPMIQEMVSQYFGTKPFFGEPDLAVAKGTALRAAELSGVSIDHTALSGRTLKEVAGRTIGVGVKGDKVLTLIERSTPIPAEAHCSFRTQRDGQTDMAVVLYEESKSRIDESRSIGQLRYKGLKRAPAGERKIDFTFTLDEDGLLHVTANVEGKEYNKTIKLG